jgi:hypothetical protein
LRRFELRRQKARSAAPAATGATLDCVDGERLDCAALAAAGRALSDGVEAQDKQPADLPEPAEGLGALTLISKRCTGIAFCWNEMTLGLPDDDADVTGARHHPIT